NRVVTATGAQRGYRPFVVAMGEPELVRRQARMTHLWFGDVSHSAASRALGLCRFIRSEISLMMKRAVTGAPSQCRMEMNFAGSMEHSLVSRNRICASRFCSIMKT